jgi:hypothetical protein
VNHLNAVTLIIVFASFLVVTLIGFASARWRPAEDLMNPSWFAGIADSAIVIGVLVPAAVMSIAAANLFTRTIYKELFRPYATPAEETRVARLASLLMKVGALGFALELNKTFSINLQLLGGIWILQTFPAIVIGLYTRWFHRIALIIGWAAGMAYGTVQAYRRSGGGQAHFGASVAPVFGHTTYIAVTALIVNLLVAAMLTLVFRKIGLQDGYDETRPSDYLADPVTVPGAAPGPGKTEPPPASWSPPEGPPASWSPPEPPPSSWSSAEPPAAFSGWSEPPSSPPDQPARPGEPGSPAESVVTDLLASLFAPAPPTAPEPISFPAPAEPRPRRSFGLSRRPRRTLMRQPSRRPSQPHPHHLHHCSPQPPGPCWLPPIAATTTG